MENGNIPEYLYHYTSIEKLALILKNRTIRLNTINKMDDLQESKTSDIQNAGQYVLVSSWTADPTESIPMWKMYTQMNAGVRIKLPSNPFKRLGTTVESVKENIGYNLIDETENGVIDTFLDIGKMMGQGIWSPQAWDGNVLTKVIYTSEKELLEPSVLVQSKEETSVLFGMLGKHKNIHWEFQHEWRYIMSFLPVDYKHPLDEKEIERMFRRILSGETTMPFDFFDLEIADTAFSQMEIVLSPQISVGNKVLLTALVEKYNPDAQIQESTLLGLL